MGYTHPMLTEDLLNRKISMNLVEITINLGNKK